MEDNDIYGFQRITPGSGGVSSHKTGISAEGHRSVADRFTATQSDFGGCRRAILQQPVDGDHRAAAGEGGVYGIHRKPQRAGAVGVQPHRIGVGGYIGKSVSPAGVGKRATQHGAIL